MPAPGPVLIQYIMSKLLLAAAPIETLIKAIKGSSWGGAWGEEAVSCVYTGVTGRVSVHGCLKGEQGRRSFVVMGRGEHLLSPATLPPSLVILSTPSSGCSVWAEADGGWFIALQQREANVVISCCTSAQKGGEYCSVADQLINLGPWTTTMSLGHCWGRPALYRSNPVTSTKPADMHLTDNSNKC